MNERLAVENGVLSPQHCLTFTEIAHVERQTHDHEKDKITMAVRINVKQVDTIDNSVDPSRWVTTEASRNNICLYIWDNLSH